MLTAENRTVQVGSVKIGAGQPVAVIAGPCSVESQEGLDSIAREVKAAGALILRGGTYKLRTSPYSFQGLGEEGLKMLCAAGKSYGMPVVSEIISENDIEKYTKYVDMLQIGARNMQNVALLKAAGEAETNNSAMGIPPVAYTEPVPAGRPASAARAEQRRGQPFRPVRAHL